MKKKIMPIRHDSSMCMEYVMLVYCIMEGIPVNACPALDQLPQVEVKDGIWSSVTLHGIIVVHKNKIKLKRLKTKHDGKSEVEKVDDEEEIEKEVTLK
ncbi:hypothetical protein E5676_scaffold110G002410 [Cucumis melo var. makuwa]|uniref:Uncharacterized protein n=1 Tax=Cucumis melo var. makuwa TaxID=1194695 RepID=A0A5A7T268_CUCMM|nr:hypothetical protein E6C27_scaffold20G001780 [Cucumis melo var. makuwa]TYJ95928.1 hypothetical protein E5676_scaffold110G002410 [Cucumis melo var. makuwa]